MLSRLRGHQLIVLLFFTSMGSTSSFLVPRRDLTRSLTCLTTFKLQHHVFSSSSSSLSIIPLRSGEQAGVFDTTIAATTKMDFMINMAVRVLGFTAAGVVLAFVAFVAHSVMTNPNPYRVVSLERVNPGLWATMIEKANLKPGETLVRHRPELIYEMVQITNPIMLEDVVFTEQSYAWMGLVVKDSEGTLTEKERELYAKLFVAYQLANLGLKKQLMPGESLEDRPELKELFKQTIKAAGEELGNPEIDDSTFDKLLATVKGHGVPNNNGAEQ